MDCTNFFHGQQETGQIADRIATFFDDFQVGTLLNKAGIKKLRGATPRAVLTAIFLLPFIGANFYSVSVFIFYLPPGYHAG